jgi:hypothetical protein
VRSGGRSEKIKVKSEKWRNMAYNLQSLEYVSPGFQAGDPNIYEKP